ncbi:glucan -beta-glucosidase [Phlyctema vagabunda]|uniref:Glucan -beta-glucosidase n=1 Tax=Phlyctema vagabunda TaxID=108571 RepID=A0ABR4PIH3_9HELO
MDTHLRIGSSGVKKAFSFGSLPTSIESSSESHEDISSLTPTNPFATPPFSRVGSTIGARSGFQYAEVPGTGYFRSRRVPKAEAVPLPVRRPKGRENLLWIMPAAGLFLGICISGLLVYLKIQSISRQTYCPVLDEDFSSGTLDPSIWTKEMEVGGYGNHQFEQTTADEENVYVKDGQLYIKPTLQDESFINTNTVINLTADGTCTSDKLYNCVAATNTTNGTIVPPVRSARLNTKRGATIKYGKVEVTAKIPKGDWLWPAIWMLPVNETYGAWPASGEIDIMESRGNNYSYSLGGNNFYTSALHWGPADDAGADAYRTTTHTRTASHSQFGDKFHKFGLEWSEKYLFTYIDNALTQALYWKFNKPLWPQGHFPFANSNGTAYQDPWSFTGRDQTPFDQEFYLILNVAVGGQNGYFLDGADGKPWGDGSPLAKTEFWAARDQWYPTWEKSGQMIINKVQMWQQC